MHPVSPECPPPDPDPRKPRLKVPAGATDCHAHVIGPQERHPFVANRSYTPPDALLPDYLHVLKTLGFQRAVLVQPSMHGDDNDVMLDAITHTKDIDMRAVVVVPPDIDTLRLHVLHERGARGVRINMIYAGGNLRFDAAAEMAARIRDFGWHLQLLIDVSEIGDRLLQLSDLPVPLVIDHFGHLSGTRGVNDRGFAAMLELVRRGNTWVKISGAYRVTEEEFPYADVRPLCEALVRESTDRIVWGTDWPHTVCRVRMPNDGDLLDLIGDWIGDDAAMKKILVTNPERLYGFR